MYRIVTDSKSGVCRAENANPGVVGMKSTDQFSQCNVWLAGKFGEDWVLCHPENPENSDMFIVVRLPGRLSLLEQVRIVIDKVLKLYQIFPGKEELSDVSSLPKAVIFDNEGSMRDFDMERENLVRAEERMAKRVKEKA